jgi:hypothetical protein
LCKGLSRGEIAGVTVIANFSFGTWHKQLKNNYKRRCADLSP